jgi:hypothetical protein
MGPISVADRHIEWSGGRGPVMRLAVSPKNMLNVPEVGVQSVRILPDQVYEQGSVTQFIVEVTPNSGGAPWRVLHRYNDFDQLRSSGGQHCRDMLRANFPRKHLTGCSGERLQKRRAALDLWLAEFVQWVQTSDDAAYLRVSLCIFLQVPFLLQVDVPPGVAAGQQFSVILPSGEEFMVTVPEKARWRGRFLQLWYENGTLQPYYRICRSRNRPGSPGSFKVAPLAHSIMTAISDDAVW